MKLRPFCYSTQENRTLASKKNKSGGKVARDTNKEYWYNPFVQEKEYEEEQDNNAYINMNTYAQSVLYYCLLKTCIVLNEDKSHHKRVNFHRY